MAIRTLKVSTYVRKIMLQAMQDNFEMDHDAVCTWQDDHSTVIINHPQSKVFYSGTYGKWEWKLDIIVYPNYPVEYSRKTVGNPKPVDEAAQNYADDMVTTH